MTDLQEGTGALGTVSKIGCTDGWQAARLLLALAVEDAQTKGARELARQLRASAPDDATFARALHAFVLANVRFVREAGELFQSGQRTLARGAGDCDDHFRLTFAIATAGGLPAALGVLSHGDEVPPDERGPAHACAVLVVDGRPCWAETTVAAAFGEEPNAAARRLGLTSDRSDIAKKVTLMSDSDLPPIPDSFRDRNDPSQVRADCAVLQELGFYPADAALLKDPTDAALRYAVVAFQRSVGILADGLLGPTTRLMLGRALASVHGGGTIGGLGNASSDLSDDDLRAVNAMVARFRAEGARATSRDFLQVWRAESGLANVQTNAKDRNGVRPLFGGFNQMGPLQRAAAGYHGDFFSGWLKMTLAEQIPYIERYYRGAAANGGGPACLANRYALYLANAAPAFMSHGADPSFPIYTPEAGTYFENRGLDRGGKGFVSVADLGVAVDGIARDARFLDAAARAERLGAEPNAPPLTPTLPGGAGNIAGLVALVGGVGALGYVAVTRGWIG